MTALKPKTQLVSVTSLSNVPERKKAGRKPKTLDAKQREEVETLAACLSQDQIAEYFGISRGTFADMMARDADILTRYKRGKAKAISSIASGLIQRAVNGDTTCMMFYLKTQAGWREREKPQPEAAAPKDTTPDIKIDFSKFNDEERVVIRRFLNSIEEA